MNTSTQRTRNFAQRGFTLIEAMVVISIMAILAGTSVSSFVWLNQSTQIRGATFDLIADLDFARSEAVKRNADVVVAPRNGDWVNGWTITFGANVLRARDACWSSSRFRCCACNLDLRWRRSRFAGDGRQLSNLSA